MALPVKVEASGMAKIAFGETWRCCPLLVALTMRSLFPDHSNVLPFVGCGRGWKGDFTLTTNLRCRWPCRDHWRIVFSDTCNSFLALPLWLAFWVEPTLLSGMAGFPAYGATILLLCCCGCPFLFLWPLFLCHSYCPFLCHLFLSPFLCHHQQGWCPWHLDLLCLRWLPHTRLMASRPALLADRTPPLHAQTATWKGFQCVWTGVVSGRLAPQ